MEDWLGILMPDIAVQVFDGILGKELTLPLVDGNYAVANFPARYSYVVPNPYGADNPLPATGLPTSSTLLVFATQNFPARFSWVSGAPVPPIANLPVLGPELGLLNVVDTLGLVNGIDELGALI